MDLFQDNTGLLARFRAGQRAALQLVYETYFAQVETLVHRGFSVDGGAHVRGVSDPELSRELIQEVSTRAFARRARRAYDGVRPYRPYLLRIVRNLMIDRVRAKRGQLETLDPVGDIDRIIESDAPFAEAQEVEGALDQKRRFEVTARYVASLDAHARALVRLRYEDGLSQVEAAKRLGLSRKQLRLQEGKVREGLVVALLEKGLYQ